MRKKIVILIAAMIIGWPGIPVLAVESHSSQTAQKAMDHASHTRKKIHESEVKGYRLAYHLLDLPGRTPKHLIIYITDSEGKPINDAKVGYLIVGPGGKEQKVIAMSMQDSFGGDVDFSAKGKYTIKSKAVVGDKSLLDSFTFMVD